MDERRVPWDVPAYLARVRSGCFVCQMVAGAPGLEHHVVHRDDVAVAFLARYPAVRGHVLVAPVDHREHAVTDFRVEEYLCVQRLVHRVGVGVSAVVPTERLYVLSLGSQQGNRHVHWHVVPLPPGVPYEQQQAAIFATERGWLDIDDTQQAALAAELARALPPDQ